MTRVILSNQLGYTEIVAADNAPDNTVVLPTESGVLATENYVDSTITAQPPTTAIEEVEKNLSHTFELEDAGKLITSTSNDPVTFTVPTDLAVDFPIGTVIAIRQAGEGVVSVLGEEEVVVWTGSGYIIYGQYDTASLIKVNVNEWRLTGNLRTSDSI